MTPEPPSVYDDTDALETDAEESELASDDDLWFLPGTMEEEPDDMPTGPRAEPSEIAFLDDWRRAEAGHAARLARVAGRLGALDDRLRRGPEGWRHRLALIEATDLSWFVGDRIGPDRLALWISLRLAGVQGDTGPLARVGWAVRRLTGGPGPEADLSAFLDRRDPENLSVEAEPFADRAGGWLDLVAQAADLHPITRAGMGFHLWSLAGLGQHGDRIEAAVTASRIAASDGKGAVFVPLANAIGMDLVQLGIMMTVNLAIGLYTPPVGTTLFITSALAKVKVGETVRELGPFYAVAFLVLLLVSYVPASIIK